MGGRGKPIDAMGGQIILARKYQELSAVDADRPAGTGEFGARMHLAHALRRLPAPAVCDPHHAAMVDRSQPPSAPRRDARRPCVRSSQRVRRQPA